MTATKRAKRATWKLPLLAAWVFALGSAAPSTTEADQYLRLKVLAVVYTDTFTDRATPAEVETVWKEVDEAAELYWRHSSMRLHLAVDHLTIDRFVPREHLWELTPEHYWLAPTGGEHEHDVEADLLDRGIGFDSYDVIAVFYAYENGPGHYSQFGGGSYGVDTLLGKAAFVSIPLAFEPDYLNRLFEHEFLHCLASIFWNSGYDAFPFPHNERAFKALEGKDNDWIPWVLGGIPDRYYFEPTGEWGTVERFSDRDLDGLPDYSPALDQLRITEETLGSSPDRRDTDRDGWSDLKEATAGLRRGTDPTNPDTDGDGLLDSEDEAPFDPAATPAEASVP